jgi:hypothetical protein
MTSNFILGFVREVDGGPETFPYWDYSRARSSNVDERRLSEAEGIRLPPEAAIADTHAGETLLSAFWCPGLERRQYFRFNAAVDFDCDGTISPGTVRVDLNGDGALTALGRGQVDWDELVFGGVSVGVSLGRPVVLVDPQEEPGRAELEEALGRPLRLEPPPERR